MTNKRTKGNHLHLVDSGASAKQVGGSGGDGGGSDTLQRIARLEALMENAATKTDMAKLETSIANLKNWILGGVIAGMVIAAGLAATIAGIVIK